MQYFQRFVGKFCPELESMLSKLPDNSKYNHASIQNELISSAAEATLDHIRKEAKEAKYWAFLSDGSRDISKKEQISVCIRYVRTDTSLVVERFVGFTKAVGGQSANQIAEAIRESLEVLRLSADGGAFVS